MIGSISGQDTNRIEARKLQAKYFEESRLKEVTLAKGESIQGTLYFILPYNVTEMNEARLSFWFIDPSVANGVIKEVSLSGIDYLRSPQLEQQRNSLVEGGAISAYAWYNSLGAFCYVPDSREAKSSSNSLNEQTALIVPPAPNDQPAMDSGITDTYTIDPPNLNEQTALIVPPIPNDQPATDSEITDTYTIDPPNLNEQTALIVPPIPNDQPATDSEITDTYVPDITGTWVSNITDNDNSNFRKENHKKLVVTFEQNGERIVGKVSSLTDGYIEGVREGDTIKFFLYSPTISSYEIRGEWKISADGYRLEGSWRHPVLVVSGKWNLTKIK